LPAEVITVAVRWYLRYGLSYRDVEELLAERGVEVDHVTVYRWVQRFTPLFADAARFARHSPGDRWFVDETYVKVAGVWRYVYRAVDQHGQVIDVLVSARRDGDAARRFFQRALSTLMVTPTEDSRSCKISAAATTNSLPKRQARFELASGSPSSLKRSETTTRTASACPDRATRQRPARSSSRASRKIPLGLPSVAVTSRSRTASSTTHCRRSR
jgi:hypothetical protein